MRSGLTSLLNRINALIYLTFAEGAGGVVAGGTNDQPHVAEGRASNSECFAADVHRGGASPWRPDSHLHL